MESAKQEANTCFKEKHFARAVALYTDALATAADASPASLAVLYSNRSAANLALENYGCVVRLERGERLFPDTGQRAALADSQLCISLDASFTKGFYRRAAALFCLGRHKEALRDYQRVARLKPNDSDAQLKLKECDRVVRAEAFAAASAFTGNPFSVQEKR